MEVDLLSDEHVLPVDREVTATTLKVTGEIPKFLNGRYVRTGPNPLPGQYDPNNYSVFGLTGDGMVHGVRLRDGRAEWYRSRWVRTPKVSRLLGERPKPVNHRVGTSLVAPQTTVFGFGGRTIVGAEGGVAPYELTDELETVGTCDFGRTLEGGYTGHPKLDPVTGELHAVTYQLVGPAIAHYVVIGTDGAVRKRVPLDVPGRPLLHDIALSENYVMIFDCPLVLDLSLLTRRYAPPFLSRIAAGVLGRFEPPALAGPLVNRAPRPKNAEVPIRWKPSHPSRIGVIPRSGPATVRWFDIEPCYVFHTLNAHEEDDSIIVDACRITGPDKDSEYRVADVLDKGRPRLHRWEIDLVTGAVKESWTDERLQEFPMVDPRRVSLPHRYGFTTSIGDTDIDTLESLDDARASLIRYDLTHGGTTEHKLEAGHIPGEFSPVPRSKNSDEADGVLIGYEYDRSTHLSNMLIIDAQSMEKLATVHLPSRIPFQFHGNWIAD
ncbi:carotenoid oxygenase family protein [Mycobacterium sp. NPDC050853]|uniref:carotenoid oxygenase family protein n=1 Tax=Mycobacterium sp. NPDC050853 TaxID=3155160 RepID=UPI0033FB0154